MYQQDSFFDLSVLGRVGLVIISTALFLLIMFLAWKYLKPHGPMIRIIGALALFWCFVWMSPQVYYMYYWMIIPDLPVQWVIWPPAGPEKAARMLIFQYRQNLSAHFQGLLGWCVIAVPFAQEAWQKIRHGNR